MLRLDSQEAVDRRVRCPHFSCESLGPTGGCSLDGTVQQSQRPVLGRGGSTEAAKWARGWEPPAGRRDKGSSFRHQAVTSA